jgi:hypothetical protein
MGKKNRPANALLRVLPVASPRPSWIGMAAGILLFGAFVAQNAVMPLASGNLRDLERKQLVIDIEQTRRDMWQAALGLSISQTGSDPKIVAQYFIYTLEANKNLIAWSAGRAGADLAEYTAKISDRDESVRRARALYASGKFEDLRLMASAAARETVVQLPADDTRFFALLDDARAREKKWYWAFLGAYVVGSCLLGTDVLIRYWLRRTRKRSSV